MSGDNLAPTGIALSNNRVNDNRPIGTVVGEFSTTDPDADDTVYTYRLVSGDRDTDNGSFSISGSNLVTAEVFDYTTQTSCASGLNQTTARAVPMKPSLRIHQRLPQRLSLSRDALYESDAIGTVAGTFSATM